MRDGCDISDVGDLEPGRIERAHRRFPARPRSLDVDLERLDTEFFHRGPDLLGRDLRCERRALPEPRKPLAPDVDQPSVLPCLSVIVMIVLLKEAWIWTTPSTTIFFARLCGRAGLLATLIS